MILTLPRDLKVDIEHVPDDFEEQVRKAFAEYTYGTSKDYTFEDKLMFIDVMMQKIHHTASFDAVEQKIFDRIHYNLVDQGELTEPSEFLNVEFMCDCYEQGRKDAQLRCNQLTDDHHVNKKVMKIVYRVIKTVMNWEPEDGK